MHTIRIVPLLAVLALTTAVPSAQLPTGGAELSASHHEPLQCWWRTSVPVVRVAEPFSLQLTCAVAESGSRRVTVDQGKLSPDAIPLSPYEVISGGELTESATPDGRFFQREYVLRVITDEAFGRDVAIPPVIVTYRLEEGADGVRTQGIERRHELPALPMRVLSLVPADARDIRELPSGTFAELDEAGFRASLLRTAGTVFMALGAIGVVLAVAHATRRRQPTDARVEALADRVVLDRVAHELRDVRRAREDGAWTAELTARALAALRVAAGYVAARVPAQRALGAREKPPEGVLMHRGSRRGRIAISSPVTARTLERAQEEARDDEGERMPMREGVADMQQALGAFTRARYGRREPEEAAPLDAALEAAERVVRELQRERTWLARAVAAATVRVTHVSRTLWSR